MENQPSAEYLMEIAKQLSCPEGEYGIRTGEAMNINNIGMTHSAIDALKLEDKNVVLEIGHGNGGHIDYLLRKAEGINYFGADISETIIAEAQKLNHIFIKKKQVSLCLSDGETLPFEENKFDRIFTVNTIYFWKNPLKYAREIKRVLKPGGLFVLGFADKTFMQSLPFTTYGFELYDEEKACDLLTTSGFILEKSELKTEEIQSNAGGFVTRNYLNLSAICR